VCSENTKTTVENYDQLEEATHWSYRNHGGRALNSS